MSEMTRREFLEESLAALGFVALPGAHFHDLAQKFHLECLCYS